jgi:hypothetical protein
MDSTIARQLATDAATDNMGIGPCPRARDDLMIGFSFSLWPDSSPGRCNEWIARSMRTDLARCSPHVQPWVGVQWEIFDALEDLNTFSFVAARFVPEHAVAGPACFYQSDIRDGAGLVELLREGKFAAVRKLAESLKIPLDAPQTPPDVAQLCAALNGIIDERNLFEAFDGLVELTDLDRRVERPELSFLGIEKRRLPTKGFYPKGLRRFQARRVNRLLIEAIVPESILARGEYLDAGQVARYVLGTLEVAAIRTVWLYAHPYHRDWCKQKTLVALRERGWPGGDDDLQFGDDAADWDATHTWDADSAQVWCRSRENWETYSRL